jgi:excisionase family DNA binding protein
MSRDQRKTSALPPVEGSHDISFSHRLTLSVEEVAVVLGISRSTAWRMVRAGTLPTLRLGRRVLIGRAALAEWLIRQVN